MLVKLVIIPCVGRNIGKRKSSALGQCIEYLLGYEFMPIVGGG